MPGRSGGSREAQSLFREHDQPLFSLPDELACLRRPSASDGSFITAFRFSFTTPGGVDSSLGWEMPETGRFFRFNFQISAGESEVFEREVNMLGPLGSLFAVFGDLRGTCLGRASPVWVRGCSQRRTSFLLARGQRQD